MVDSSCINMFMTPKQRAAEYEVYREEQEEANAMHSHNEYWQIHMFLNTLVDSRQNSINNYAYAYIYR